MKKNNLILSLCVLGMFVCLFMIGREYSSTSVYYLNTTTEYCNLSELNEVLSNNLVSIDNKFNRVRSIILNYHITQIL